MNLLDVCIVNKHPDIICLVEILPKNARIKKTIDAIQIKGYNIIAHSLRKRGICVYASPKIDIVAIDNDNIFEECVWCLISGKKETFLLGCIYRSPSSSAENDNNLCIMLRNMLSLNFKDTIIVGDFNFSNIDWDFRFSTVRSPSTDLFLDTINDLYLEQIVCSPTRIRIGQQSSLLDLVLTNSIYFVEEIIIDDPIGKSDHTVLDIIINIDIRDSLPIERRLYYRGDYDSMRAYYSDIDWYALLFDKNTQSSWDIFYDHFIIALEMCIPISNKIITHSKQPWVDKDVQKQIKKKKKSFNKYYRRPTMENWSSYVIERNLATSKIDGGRINYEKRICDASKDNPKEFWKYVNIRNNKQNHIPSIQDTNKVLYYDDESKANIFNSYFTSVLIQDNDIQGVIDNDNITGIGSICFGRKDVKGLIDNLNISKAPGPDGIHSKIIKECAEVFSHIFYIIFCKSIREGVLPGQWKEANVRALYKKGKKTVCSNYRPVSLTSIVCKLLESLIRDVLLEFLETNNKISVHQYGFRPGFSCSTQLLEVIEDFTSFTDIALDFDCIYLDFAKAFDRVSHRKLIRKLFNIGIKGNILDWISNFLTGRKQRVMINGVHSDWAMVTSGIPQGSVLGPILFTIFINDLPISLMSHVKIFADDTKIYNSVDNCTLLQDDLDKLIEWSEKWLLPFNIEKCSVVHYGKNNICTPYNMANKEVATEHIMKDLGIIFQDDVKFGDHINKIVAKANSKLGLIRNTFQELNASNFIVLFKSFVRPILEYCSTTWSPHLIMHHTEIEKVQRRATKLVKHMGHLSYSERLKRLNLTTLYYRRQRADMLQVYRIIHGIDRLDRDKFFQFNTRPSRGNSFKIIKPRALTSFKQYSFTHRCVNNWNALPEEVVQSITINIFKNKLEKCWQHKEWKYEMVYD